MSYKLRTICLLLIMLLISGSMAGVKKNKNKNKANEFIYFDKGMRHHLVVMNKFDEKLGKTVTGVIDTIQHAQTDDPASWDTGIQAPYVVAGDTVTNWYYFAADTARLLEIHASFATAGTGSWNVWDTTTAPGYTVPNTATSFLVFDVPWAISEVDTGSNGLPNGNWQVYDLDGNGLAADIPRSGAYIGYYVDGSGGPFMFMDDGFHPLTDGSWRVARTYLSALGGWYFWANSVNWTEFVQRVVVYYEQVAPLATILTSIPDYFEGNPNYPSVAAGIVDLDGTVASANLNWSINSSTTVNSAAMSIDEGTVWTADFSGSFSGGDTVYYWVDATDDGGNYRESGSRAFIVYTPPAKGTNILHVDESSNYGPGLISDALDNLGKDYYSWDVFEHGGISEYEINWGFENIIWNGFGSFELPSPFETGDHPVKKYLDDGGKLVIIDNDYLFVNGFSDDTLAAGDFGYDYLGLYSGISDYPVGDSVFYGVSGDPISAAYSLPDSLALYPGGTDGVWYIDEDYDTDWQDLVIPNEMASATFYGSYEQYGYDAAIRYNGGQFATAFFPFSLEAAESEDFEAVLANTLGWVDTVTVTSIEDNDNVANKFKLSQNYPNPFNPETKIAFTLPSTSDVRIEIFNNIGQKVRTLVNKKMTAGSKSVTWNGLDAQNKKVASGVYYYKLTAGNFTSTKKMLLIK